MGTVSSIAVPDARTGHGSAATRVDEALHAARLELERMDLRFSHYRVDSDISRWVGGRRRRRRGRRRHRARAPRVRTPASRLERRVPGTEPADERPRHRRVREGLRDRPRGRRAAPARPGELRASAWAGTPRSRGGRPTIARGRSPCRTPRAGSASLAVIPVVDGAVATSGTAERGEHIWLGDRPRPERASAPSP